MLSLAKISNQIAHSVVSRLENKNEDDQEVIAYGIHILLSNITRSALTLLIVWILGYLQAYLVTLLVITFLRFFSGGLHLEKPLTCFFTTWFYYSLPALLPNLNLIPRNPLLYAVLAGLFLILTFAYAPADSNERPLLNPSRRLWLKRLSILTVGITMVLNWFYMADIHYFQLVTYTVMLSIYLILPITYKIHGRRYRNYDYADEYLG